MMMMIIITMMMMMIMMMMMMMIVLVQGATPKGNVEQAFQLGGHMFLVKRPVEPCLLHNVAKSIEAHNLSIFLVHDHPE
jgi:hypothetical protein